MYWYSRFLFERALALMYLVAFIDAANQFVPLLGQRGLLPIGTFVSAVPFRASPSLFYFMPTDAALKAAAWIGVGVSCLLLTGYPGQRGWLVSALAWGTLWVLYLSFVNVGQTFYGFGWESLLLETGFLAIFLGATGSQPSFIHTVLLRWVLFRIMFGAGLIKLRGDPCWRHLTCLDYYFETQPMPNPLSWYFHWLPRGVLHGGVAFNHFAELIVPFGYFLPQPICSIAGLITIVFQLTLIASGNLSWLNWITIVLAIPTIDDRWLRWLPISQPALAAESTAYQTAVYMLTAVVVFLSISPALNMVSPNQVMNTSYTPLQLVNTYGAFGSITRTRDEIVLEGTDDAALTEQSVWRAYELKGKPGDPYRRPPQVAPYHLRLDWLMWFAAMSSPNQHPWFSALLVKLLQGDAATLGLLRTNPFPDHPPRYIRAQFYEYHFTTREEHRRTGAWWTRTLQGSYFPPVSLQDVQGRTR